MIYRIKNLAAVVGLLASIAAIAQLLDSNEQTGILIGLMFLLSWAWMLMQMAFYLRKSYVGRDVINDPSDAIDVGRDLSTNADAIAKNIVEGGRSKLSVRLQTTINYVATAAGCYYMILVSPKFVVTGVALGASTIILMIYDFLDGTGPGRTIAKKFNLNTHKPKDNDTLMPLSPQFNQ